MSAIHQQKQPDVDLRMLLFPFVTFSLLIVLFLRLWYIQVVMSEALTERAEASREQRISKLAPRGIMVDRRGVTVAGMKSEVVITAVPDEVRKQPEVVARVAQILNVDPKRLEAKIADNYRRYSAAPIFVGAPIQAAVKIAELSEQLPGIGVETQPMRYYPDSMSFTHVVGSVRLPTKQDVERLTELNVEPSQYVGRDGIERAYELDLMGVPGLERLEVDARGRPAKVVGREMAEPGNRLVLTLDSRLQKVASEAFREKGFTGGAVALDPRNGEVLCLVSSPTFDQNLFQGGITNAEWQMLQEHPGKPMLNRAIYSSYSPGSTFKIVNAYASYKRGIYNPNATVNCQGGYRLGRRFAKCLGRHGPIAFHRAMVVSCNTYFFTMAMRSGEAALRQAALEMGLGEPTGLEVIGEGRGIVPTEDWIAKNRKPPVWTGGDTLNMGIGQGELRCTPLQMANVVAMVANGGVNYKPHLVREVRSVHGDLVRKIEPEIAHQTDARPRFWELERAALLDVVEAGTARVAQIPGIKWGGKTGSTEHGRGQKTHGWFVGFAPYENPTIAVAVLVEAGGHGGAVAAPIARDIVSAYLSEASASRNDATSASAASASAVRPAAR